MGNNSAGSSSSGNISSGGSNSSGGSTSGGVSGGSNSSGGSTSGGVSGGSNSNGSSSGGSSLSGGTSGGTVSNGSSSSGSSSSDSSADKGSDSTQIGGQLPDLGFSQEMSNVYVCTENGTYYGEIITQPNVTIIYIKKRSDTFDNKIKSVITSLLPNEYMQVWNNYITANTDRTFTVEDRMVRIVVASNGGHSQIVIYN